MNEPEIEHVLQNRYIVEFDDAEELELVHRAVSFAAGMEEDVDVRMAMYQVLADMNQMQQTYRNAHRRVADALAEQFGEEILN